MALSKIFIMIETIQRAADDGTDLWMADEPVEAGDDEEAAALEAALAMSMEVDAGDEKGRVACMLRVWA